VVALAGKRQVGEATPVTPRQSIDSIKTDVETVKEHGQRDRDA
jgi:hypothetical protein